MDSVTHQAVVWALHSEFPVYLFLLLLLLLLHLLLPKNLILFYFNPKQMIRQFLSLSQLLAWEGFLRGEKGRGLSPRLGLRPWTPWNRQMHGWCMDVREQQACGCWLQASPPPPSCSPSHPPPIPLCFVLVKTEGLASFQVAKTALSLEPLPPATSPVPIAGLREGQILNKHLQTPGKVERSFAACIGHLSPEDRKLGATLSLTSPLLSFGLHLHEEGRGFWLVSPPKITDELMLNRMRGS